MADDGARIAQLEAELWEREADLRQARAENDALREEQAAAAEILRAIASSPKDPDRVLDAAVDTARRLCDADAATIHEREGDHLRRRAESWGRLRPPTVPFPGAASRPIQGTAVGRALTSAEVVRIGDIDTVA